MDILRRLSSLSEWLIIVEVQVEEKLFTRKTQSFRFYFNFFGRKKLFPHYFLNDRLIDKSRLNTALEDHLVQPGVENSVLN